MSKPKRNLVSLVVIGLFAFGQLALFNNILAPSCINQQRTDDDLSPAGVDRSQYRQANIESNGFFTDIEQADWDRLKQRIQTKQDHANAEVASGVVFDPARFYQNAYEPYFTCRGEVRMGGMGDGPKWVCDPHRIGNAPNGEPSCLVYSIGCAGKIEFERGLQQWFGSACEIHVFDVTGYNRRNGNFTTIVQSVGGQFHQWGIGTVEQSAKNPTQFQTMEETVRKLGHAGRTIDLFKIDCEGCEWYTYKEWFQAGVDIRQVLVEVHSVKNPETFDFFKHMDDLGYVIFHKEANVLATPWGDAWEYAFIKLNIF